MVGQTRFDNGNRNFSRTRFLRVLPRVPDEPSGFCPTKARKFRISAFRNTRRRAEASEIAVTKNMRSWRLPRHFLIKIARIRRFSQKSDPPPHWEMNPRSARSPIPCPAEINEISCLTGLIPDWICAGWRGSADASTVLAARALVSR